MIAEYDKERFSNRIRGEVILVRISVSVISLQKVQFMSRN